MIRNLLSRILAPRHPWRRLSFTELSEMYLSTFLRVLAMGMIGIFLPIYLYQNGYSLTVILAYYTLFYVFGLPLDYFVARLVAHFGPKHIMRNSFLAQGIFSLMVINIHHLPLPIPMIAFVASLASTMYFIPYNTSFSKVKHSEHSGKEVSFMHIIERVGGVIGPIVGGAIATFAMPTLAFGVAAVAMFTASIVLMMSPEPVRTKQQLKFKGLKMKQHWRDYIAVGALCGENAISILMWPVFLSIVVFQSSPYLKLGFVSSASVLIAIIVALPLGRLLDRQKGKAMIRYGTFVNALVSVMRIGVSNLFGSLLVAVVNEPNTLVYRIAFIKGYYDNADDYPGYRIAYLAANEMVADCFRAFSFAFLMILSLFLTPYAVCSIAFLLAAAYSFLIRLERFPALK